MDPSDIDLVSPAAFAEGHPWEQYAWLGATRRCLARGTRGPRLLGDHQVRRHPRRSAASPSCSARIARGVMMAEPDERASSRPADDADRWTRPSTTGSSCSSAGGSRRRTPSCSRDAHRTSWPREIVDDVIERGECDLVARRRRPPAVGADRRADGHPPRRRRAALRADRDHAHHRRRRGAARGAGRGDRPRCSATPSDVAERKRGRARRRHRVDARQGRGRRRPADRRRAPVVLPAARQRRRRHDPQPRRRRASSCCSTTPTSAPGCWPTSTA